MRYCIATTYECNWNCPYCITDTHNKTRSFREAVEKVGLLDHGQKVSLSGGEPGLLETDQLLELVRRLKEKDCEVQIVSNGTIFNHPEVIEVVDSVFYHCTINMDIDDEVNRDYPDKTMYMVVITDNNIHNLDAFMEKHSDLDIMLFGAEPVPVDGKIGESLSKINALKVAVKYKVPKDRLTYLLGRDYQNDLVIL